MPNILFKPSQEKSAYKVSLAEGETLLDGLLKNGVDVPFGCKSGVCQSCLMKSDSDKIPTLAQEGLKLSQKAQGLFMTCLCHPPEGFNVEPPELKGYLLPARVLQKEILSKNTMRLRVEKVVNYRSGQFMTLWNENKIARSYSTASLPIKDNFIEFHIKRIESGKFSNWAWKELDEGSSINLQGPMGECFYTKTEFNQPIFLSGIGTGLAPLYGIARDALDQGHSGLIKLFIGGKQSSDFYLIDELHNLEESFDNFSVTFVAEKKDLPSEKFAETILEGNIYTEVQRAFPSFKDYRVFLCGAESFVRKMKKICFLAGASMREITCDAFIPFAKGQIDI